MCDYYDFKLMCLEVLVWYLVWLRPKKIENHLCRVHSCPKRFYKGLGARTLHSGV